MPPKRTASATTIQPPQLPQSLASAPPPDMLIDQTSFTGQALNDGMFAAQTAEDVLFEQVVGKRLVLNQAELALAQLFDTRFDGCDLAGSTWNKAHWRRAELLGCRMIGMKVLDSGLEDMLFQKCNGELARFWSTSFKRARFEQCVLREASFVDSHLSGVIFRDCDLSNADLRGAKLNGANFRGSNISGVQVSIEALRGTIMDAAQVVQLASLLGITIKEIENEAL
jgi:uncharacterized protein YjbI with pentapeptide repeats